MTPESVIENLDKAAVMRNVQDLAMLQRNSKPTIVTVAEAAGVSTATVSRVVRGHPDVNTVTRERVLAVIKEFDYRPSALARALVSGRSRTLGLVVSDITNPFYPQLAKSVEQEAATLGHAVLICNTSDDPDTDLLCIDRLLDQRIAGIIHGSVGDWEEAIIQRVGEETPIVFVNRRPQSSRAHYVVADNVLGGRKLAEHLIEQGHRRIGFVGGPTFATNANERLQGFLDTAADAGMAEDILVASGPFGQSTGRTAAAEWLHREDRPTAIIGVNDNVALGAMEAVLGAGLRVPEDIAIAGFDDTELAGSAVISLTSVALHIGEMGRRAVRATMRLARQKSARVVHDMLEPELRVRRTTLAAVAGSASSPT